MIYVQRPDVYSRAKPFHSKRAPLLLREALGFSTQLLLGNIINIANTAAQDGVNGMEEFLPVDS